MYPIFFKFGPITLYSYGLMVALGFATGVLVSLYFAKKEGIPKEIIFDLAIYVLVGGIIGARAFYVIGQWDYFKNNLLEIIMLQKGGLVIYGSIIFVFLIIIWYAKKKNLSLLKLLDAVTPGMLLGYSIGRIGCFLNGCCFGLPTKLPWGVVFPPSALAYQYLDGEHLHPTQLYASVSTFIAFLIVLFIYKNKKIDGQVFLWGLTLYSIYRFLVEFLRYSPIRGAGLTPSQWFALATFSISLTLLTLQAKREK